MPKDPRSQTNAVALILQDDVDSLYWSNSFRVGEAGEAIEVAGGFMTTIRVGAEQFRRQLTDLLNRVSYGGDEVIVERNGRPLVILKQYEEVDQVTELSQNQIERTRTLAEELETARLNTGISYEELARALRLERLRTLREKYPDFAAQFAEELSEEQADATTTAGA